MIAELYGGERALILIVFVIFAIYVVIVTSNNRTPKP